MRSSGALSRSLRGHGIPRVASYACGVRALGASPIGTREPRLRGGAVYRRTARVAMSRVRIAGCGKFGRPPAAPLAWRVAKAMSESEERPETFEENPPDLAAVRAFLESLQTEICGTLERLDGEATFRREEIPRPGGGVSRPRVLEGGPVLEKAAVQFTHTHGAEMPKAATERRSELAGRTYEALSVSLIVHPRNPYVPTCHANYRFFLAHDPRGVAPVWWFGGGGAGFRRSGTARTGTHETQGAARFASSRCRGPGTAPQGQGRGLPVTARPCGRYCPDHRGHPSHRRRCRGIDPLAPTRRAQTSCWCRSHRTISRTTHTPTEGGVVVS